MKSFAFVLMILFGATNAFAFSETHLRNLIRDGIDAYNWNCSGTACYEVWQNQIRTLNRLSNFVDSEIADESEISANIGRSAYILADRVCRTTARAPHQVLIRIVTAENRALRRLETIQTLAKLKRIRNCEKVIN